MSSELDCTGSLQPCACTANQICVQIGRSSTECAKNTCVDKQAAGVGRSGSSVGAVAGQAVGGVIGGLVIIVAVYWFWWRRRSSGKHGNSVGARTPSAKKGINGLKDFRMGGTEKYASTTPGQHNNHPLHRSSHNITGPPGPGEEDAQPVKRQSLRFDANNSGGTVSRRSLSGAQNILAGSSNGTASDNPFADHHSEGRKRTSSDPRQSTATISEFSFRSSHSTNIIPIAYIPAHSSQNSTIDMTAMHDSRRPRSASTLGARDSNTFGYGGALGNKERTSRASVPISLRSASTSNMHDSMNGATFSGLFDNRRTSAGSTRHPERPSEDGGSQNGLEIIAPNMGATSPPQLTTPTFTKDGRPIRPPRAPGLDLKLPTPDAISPPTSPGFPWSRGMASPTGALFPGAASPDSALAPSRSPQPRETLLTPASANFPNARGSAYSTFSQATTSSSSHMSYILETPQIVTPISAGGIQVQTLTRTAAKAVKLPQSGGLAARGNAGSLSPLSDGMSKDGTSPTNAQMGVYPASPGAQYASSPLAMSARRISGMSTSSSGSGRTQSPLGDNPFDDEAAVRIEMPSQPGAGDGGALPLTPTFGPSPARTPFPQQGSQAGHTDDRAASRATTRRDSDLSIFTSSEAHTGRYSSHQPSIAPGDRRATRNSFASSFASEAQHRPDSAMRRPSPTSFVGTLGHSDGSKAPSVASASDEVILEPPNRPFAHDGASNADSRHNSAAMSTRSGYASVLDGIPFNLSMSPEQRNSQASDAGMSVPFHFPGAARNHLSQGSSIGGMPGNHRDSAATFRTSMASSAAPSSDKRDTSYSLASEWNGAFGGMPIMMGGPAQAVPEVPSMYQQSAPTKRDSQDNVSSQQHMQRDERYSTDSLALAAAVARQFDEGRD